MTENTRLRLGAYFLFAILLLTLPVTLLVTHLDTARHAQQWVATDTGVKLVNADHHDRSVAWVQKSYGLSKSGAQKFAYDTERKTKTRLDTTQTVPYGTQIDYYDVDGRKAPQTAKILNSMIVEKASSPAALDYIAAVQNPEWKKSEPTAAADALDALQSTLKKGYVLIPAAFTQSAAQAQKTGSGTSTGRASTASNPRHGLNIPAGRSTKATTTHYRVAVVATRFPGWRDIAPRSDYDTDPNDSGMASQGATGYSPITVTYGTGASNPGAATPAYTPVEVCYRQAIQNPLLPPPPNVYNYATRINAGADATFRDEPYSLAGYVAGHNLDLGSLYDSPGGVFSTTNWGIPGGVVGGWDYTEAPTWPAPMDSTITDLQNRFYDWLYDPGMSALSANNWFYQNTHGQVRIDGAPSDVYGWNFSAHVTNRYVYQTGGGNEELIFPGTPIIRSGVSGSNPAADQIVRASLSGNGLTILFSRPVPNFNVGNLSLVVYTNSTVTTGVTAPNYTQTTGGYVKIVWGATPVTYSVQQDPYDNRRWTVRAGGGSGFKYQALSGATATPTTTSLPWVPQEGTLWNLAYNGWPDTNGTVLTATTVGSLGNADPNVSPISFTYQNQTNSPDTVHYAASQGSPLLGVGEGAGDPFADSTLICDADMKLALFDSGQAIAGIGTPNAAVGFDARSYARLRSIDYYAHNYMGAGNAYQISHTYTVGPSSGSLFPDDIAGTTYTGSQHVLRPPPFDHDSSDPGNGGYWSRVNEKYSGNHRYGKYIADVGRVMQDNGITVPSAATGYQAVIYVAADNLGNPGTSVGETNPAGTTFQPASDLQGLNESSGLGTYFHELSHALVGAADLYDRNLYDNAGSPPPVPPYHQCNMMGPYSIMAAGGRLDAYHLAGGLVTPVDVQQDTLGADIPEIEGLVRDPVIVKLPGNPYYIKKNVAPGSWKEYFLLENRNVTGTGAYGLDGSNHGLYIYHVDTRNPGFNTTPTDTAQGHFQKDDNVPSVMMEQSDGWHELEFSDAGQATNAVKDVFGHLTAGGTNVTRFWQWPMFGGDTNDFGAVVSLPDVPTPQAGNGWSRVGAKQGGSPTSYSHGYTYTELSGGQNVMVPSTTTDSFTRVVNISQPGVDITADLYVQPAEVRVVGTSQITNLTYTITNITRAAGVTTATFAAAPGFVVGETISVSGVTDTTFNGMFIVTAVGPVGTPANTITFAQPSVAAAGPIAGGTAKAKSGLVRQGQTDVGIMNLLMENRNGTTAGGLTDQSRMSTQDVYIDTLYVLESGTSNNGTDVSAFKLYADTDDNGRFNPKSRGGADSQLATATIVTDPTSKFYGYAVFQNVGYRVPLGDETNHIFIACDIAPEAQTNPFVTVGAEFTDASKIQPRLPGTVEVRQRRDANPASDQPADYYNFGPTTSGYTGNEVDTEAQKKDYFFPVLSNTTIIHNAPDRLVLTQTALPAASATPGQANLPMLRMHLETNKGGTPRTQGSVRLNSLKVEATDVGVAPNDGFLATSELTNAVLYDDTNRDGLINTGDVLLGTSSFTLNGSLQQATFLNLDLQVLAGSANSKDLLVGVNVAPGAAVHHAFTLSVKFPKPGDWATPSTGTQELCYLQVINATTETAENKDYVDSSVDSGWTAAPNPPSYPNQVQIASTTTTIIDPDQPPTRPVAGFTVDGVAETAGLVTFDQNPTLAWTAASDPDPADTQTTLRYDVDLATDGSFNTLYRPEVTVGPSNIVSWKVPAPVLPQGTYFWRVRTRDSSGMTSTWSDVQQFAVQVNQPPNQITTGFTVDTIPEPPNVSVTRKTPTLSWNKATDPNPADLQTDVVYELQVDDNADFSSPVPLTNYGVGLGQWASAEVDPLYPGAALSHADQNTYQVVTADNLQWGVTYYWRVRAKDVHGMWSLWTNQAPGSTTLWFKPVNDRAPNTPVAPFIYSDGAEVNSANPVLQWSMPATPDPDPTDTLNTITYDVQVGTDVDLSSGPYAFSATVPASATSPITKAVTTALTDNTHYYWRVRAVDDETVVSPWTAVQDFWINTVNDPPVPPVQGFNPVNASTVATATPTLSWDNTWVAQDPLLDVDSDPYDGAYDGAGDPRVNGVSWVVELSTSPAFGTISYTYNVARRAAPGDPQLVIPTALTNGATWYWRVWSVDNDNARSGSPSTAQHFAVNTAYHAPTPPSSGFIPAAGTSVSSTSPLLQWGPGADIDAADTTNVLRYEVQVAADPAFATGPGYFWSGGPTAAGQQMLTVGVPLAITTPATTYYWRVRTVDTTGLRSAWYQPPTPLNFSVVANRPPNPITSGFAPTGLLQVSDTTPGLTWNAATPPDPDADDTADTITYRVEVDNNNSFNSPEWSGNASLPYADPLHPVATVATPLLVGVTYYWHVRAVDDSVPTPGVSAWSAPQSFRIVANQAPYVPVAPFAPADGAEVSDATPRITWTAATPPDPNVSDTAATIHYEIQLDDVADLSAGPYVYTEDLPVGQTFADVNVALQDNVHYYYRIRAIDTGNLSSPWTAVQDFYCNTVNNPPVAPSVGFDPASGATTPSLRPTVSWDNSTDPDPDPYDGNVTAGRVVGVTFTVEFSLHPNFTPVAYSYTTLPGVSTLTPTADLTDHTVWYWHVKAVDDDGAASAFGSTQSLTVDTTQTPPTAPTAGFVPTGGANVSSLVPQLSWNAGADTDTGQGPETLRYQAQVAEDAAFATAPGYFWTSVLTTAGTTNTTVAASPALVMGKTYYWRVRTVDPTNLYSGWSVSQRFVVGANRPPNAIVAGFAPNGGTTVADATPVLTWAAAVPPDPDADDIASLITYEVVVDNNSNFGTPEFTGITALGYPDPLQPTITVTTPLTVGVTYFWRVRARDNQLPTPAVGVWSANQSFRIVANQAPAVPIATFVPTGGAIVTDATPTLSWNNPNPPNPVDPNPSDTIDTIRYEVQVNDSPDFSTAALYSGITPEGQSSLDVPVANALLDNTRYYWRVRALDRGGLRSAWTTTQDFWVNTVNNDPAPPVDGFVPVNAAGLATATPRLNWNPGSDPDPGDLPATLRYQVQLSTDGAFGTVAYTYATTNPGTLFVDLTSALTDGTTWYWRVATVDSTGAVSPWSTVLHFAVDLANQVPNPPTAGFNPANGQNVSDLTPTLTFGAGSDPDTTDTKTLHYEVELADTNAFPAPAPAGGYYWTGTTANGVTTITVPDPKLLTLGKTYYWRVRTVDASNTRSIWSVIQNFVVGGNQPPNAPTSGFIPTGGTGVSDPTPALIWDPATDPDANDTADVLRYQAVVDDNADFSSPLFDRVTTAGSATIVCVPTTALQVGATYYWRVVTIDAAGARSAPSATQQFRLIKNRAPFTPVAAFAPAGAVEITTANPTLTWNMPALPDPDPNDTLARIKYQVQLKDLADLASAPYTFTLTTALNTRQAVVTTNLQDNTQYWWRVRSVDGGGLKSDWTTALTFWVNLVNQAPLPPDAGFDPANGRQINDSTPTLLWTAATDPDPFDTADTLHYVVELSTSPTIATVSYQLTTADGVVQARVRTALTDKTRWYWRVRTVDGAGALSSWSAIQNFVLDMNNQPPTLTNPVVTPMYGSLADYYTLQVTYTDAENDPSGKVFCQFDNGQPALEMSKVNAADIIAVDGIVYQVGIAGATLGLGAHGHYFYCDAGARLPNTGYDTGPVIGKLSSTHFTNVAGATVTNYQEGYPVYVKVRDQDQNLDPTLAETVAVTVTEAGGDSETFALTETGPNTSDFIGSLKTLGKTGAPNDGVLNAIGGTSGNQLTATYQDPNDGANPTPDRSTATAMLVDTKAPSQVGALLLAKSGPDGRTVDLNWTAYAEATAPDGAGYSQVDVAGYHVYYGTATIKTTAGLTPVATVAAGTQTFQMTGLIPNKAYYFAVAAFDEVPNENANVVSRWIRTQDSTPPTISGQIPADEATEVARDTAITFYLDDPGVGVNRNELQVDLTQSVKGIVTPVLYASVVTLEPDVRHVKVTLTPTKPFDWNALVKVDVDVEDKDGNPLHVRDWNFSTVTDTELPTLDQQVPAPKATNVAVSSSIAFHLKDGKSGIVYDPKAVPAIVDSISMKVNGNPVAADALTCTGSPNDLAVLYDPIVDLNYSTVYTVEVTAHDVAGNVVGPVTWSFTTVKDVSGVAADQFVPDRNAIDVPIETNISLRLTDSQAGIDASKLQMWVQGAEVTDLLTVDQTPNPSTHPTTLVVTYNPPLDLPYGTDIPVRVYVKDAVGNETNLSYKFRTTDAPTYTVSGVITDAAGKALGGVTVTAGGLTATSDGTGGYRISGLLKGTYTVTPTRDQYDFVPASLSKALGPDDAVDVNFVGTLRTYKVSGRVTLGGSGIAGVLVSCNGQTRTTVANGTYPAFDLPNGQYTVTPTKANFHFQPTSRAAQVDSAPVTGVDFAAIADTFTISGTVKDNAGNRVKGVQVKAADKAGLQASLVAVTSDAGLYQLAGLKAGDFTLSATKAGYTITRDTYVVTVPPSAIDVDFTAMVEMTNTFPAGWNLIGLPGSPVDTDATKVFGTVQCYRYDPEATPPTYRAPINDPTLEVVRVKPGRGFFVRYTTAQTLSVGGLPTDSTKATSLGLSNGWNMIANPLATPVKWSRFVPSQPAGIRPYAFVFDTTTRSYKMVSNVASVNADRDSLMGWEGGWVRAVSGGVSLVLGSSASASADEVLRPQQADLNGGWAIAVQAKAGKLGDFSSVAGLVPGSGSAHVVENPPTAPEAVDVYFTNSAGQRLAHDVRSQSGPQTYDFVVACGVPAVNVTVSLPDLSKVPADQQIMLIDKDAGKTMYARTVSSYTYHNAAAGGERKFQLVVEPRNIGALVVTSTAAATKGEGIVFTYSVTKGCQVTMRVLNLAGRPVKVLTLDKTVSAGVQTQLWNLTSESGTRVPAGAYLLQIDAVAENGQSVRGLTQVSVGR